MNNAKVSIIILNYNGMFYTKGCLESVLNTNYPNFEIIFVDNASTDGSLQYAKEKFGHDTRIKFVENDRNYGWPLGNNIGLKHSNGKYVIFLNMDVEVTPEWLRELVNTMESDPTIGVAGPKELLMRDRVRLVTCGHMFTFYGIPLERGVGELDEGQYDYIAEIFGAHGAAIMVRRKVLEEIGSFDSDFIIMISETDFCWRVWLRGYRVVFVPSSVIYHDVGGTIKSMSKRKQTSVISAMERRHTFLTLRNNLISFIKNLEFSNVAKTTTSYILTSFVLGLIQGINGQDVYYLPSLVRAIAWVIRNFRFVMKKRIRIQCLIRRKRDREIIPRIKVRPPIKIGKLLPATARTIEEYIRLASLKG